MINYVECNFKNYLNENKILIEGELYDKSHKQALEILNIVKSLIIDAHNSQKETLIYSEKSLLETIFGWVRDLFIPQFITSGKPIDSNLWHGPRMYMLLLVFLNKLGFGNLVLVNLIFRLAEEYPKMNFNINRKKINYKSDVNIEIIIYNKQKNAKKFFSNHFGSDEQYGSYVWLRNKIIILLDLEDSINKCLHDLEYILLHELTHKNTKLSKISLLKQQKYHEDPHEVEAFSNNIVFISNKYDINIILLMIYVFYHSDEKIVKLYFNYIRDNFELIKISYEKYIELSAKYKSIKNQDNLYAMLSKKLPEFIMENLKKLRYQI